MAGPVVVKRPCSWPGCNTLVSSGRCERHAIQTRRMVDARRGSAASRGYNYKWRKARSRFLTHHPLCAACFSSGRVNPSSEVDHIRPHKGDEALFWDERNWQALCKACHSRKTNSEDGGFGNAPTGG